MLVYFFLIDIYILFHCVVYIYFFMSIKSMKRKPVLILFVICLVFVFMSKPKNNDLINWKRNRK